MGQGILLPVSFVSTSILLGHDLVMGKDGIHTLFLGAWRLNFKKHFFKWIFYKVRNFFFFLLLHENPSTYCAETLRCSGLLSCCDFWVLSFLPSSCQSAVNSGFRCQLHYYYYFNEGLFSEREPWIGLPNLPFARQERGRLNANLLTRWPLLATTGGLPEPWTLTRVGKCFFLWGDEVQWKRNPFLSHP